MKHPPACPTRPLSLLLAVGMSLMGLLPLAGCSERATPPPAALSEAVSSASEASAAPQSADPQSAHTPEASGLAPSALDTSGPAGGGQPPTGTDPLRIRTAAGARQGVYYEIFVRAFADGDGDGIGDLRGLTEKLDYLNDGQDGTTADLGVTGLWLMPIHPSPSYHGYDVTNYRDIHPDYGTMEDFGIFLEQAHRRGISVLIDLVLNHTSVQHPWFVKSAAKDPLYRNWYSWAEPGDEQYALSARVWGNPVWISRNSSLYYAIFWDGMPDLNYGEQAVREEMKEIAAWWLEQGVDGFRLDAVPHIYGTAELPNNQPGLEKTLAWWEEFRALCRSVNPDVLLVGEVLDRMAVRLPYASSFDSVFHVDLGEAIAQAVKGGGSRNDYLATLLERELGQYRAVNPDFLNTPFLSNHDQNRIYGLLAGNPERMKLAASLYLLSEGLPFLYYGEEIGMFGSKPDEDIRLPLVWGEDPAQTSWRTSRYTKVTPVSEQTADPDSLLTHYRRLIQLKTAHPSLYKGQLKAVPAGNPAIVAWRLDAPEESALVLHNLSTDPVVFTPSESGAEDGFVPVFEQVPASSGQTLGTPLKSQDTLTLHPQSTLVLVRSTGGTP